MHIFGLSPIVDIFIAVFASVMASGGFWAFIQKKSENKSANTTLLLGMAHDRIVYIGKTYIHRGYLTLDEYEDFMKYLYEPYSKFGGNGLAERIVEEVRRLPVVPSSRPSMKRKSQNGEASRGE